MLSTSTLPKYEPNGGCGSPKKEVEQEAGYLHGSFRAEADLDHPGALCSCPFVNRFQISLVLLMKEDWANSSSRFEKYEE